MPSNIECDHLVSIAIEHCSTDPEVLVNQGRYALDTFLTEHAEAVAAFNTLAGQTPPKELCIPDEKTRILRAKLILEEALETMEGLGVKVTFPFQYPGIDVMEYLPVNMDTVEILPDSSRNPDLITIIDGCLDLRVVTTGTLIACGVPDLPHLQREVDNNNLLKFRKDKDGYKREDGKWIKPSDHPKPRLKEMLKAISDMWGRKGLKI